MGVSLGVDLSGLEVCFGGFSPTLMGGDSTASVQRAVEVEARLRERRASLERAAALEAARASEERSWRDEAGTLWRYVILDGREVRIEGCEAAQALLDVPAAIEGLPVVALADDACAYQEGVEEVICPEGLVAVGYCAFRGNRRLRRISFPQQLAAYDSDWLRGCDRLEELVLPGSMPVLGPAVFDNPSLERLLVGPGTERVEPGAFNRSALTSIEVDGASPFLASDGVALYRRDEQSLVALAVPQSSYRVAPGCRSIGRKAFSGFAGLERVELPDTVESIGDHAFAHTAIREFVAPTSLERIGERAFHGCGRLMEARLGEGLRSIGDHAFTGTALQALRLPASIRSIGNPLAAGTQLRCAGPDATLSIAREGAVLELDGAGGLYQKGGEGPRLVRFMDRAARSYAVRAGTVAVEPRAFQGFEALEEARLPEGVREVGEAAFKGCRGLRRIELPESLGRLGPEALLDTGLESLRLPARLVDVGDRAIVPYGSHHGKEPPSLGTIEVAEGNPRFLMEGSLLLERLGDGGLRVLLCTGSEEEVSLPDAVREVAPYALGGVAGIRRLRLTDRIKQVGPRGLAVDGLVERLVVDLEEPVEGHDRFDLSFPGTDRSAQQQMLALSVPGRVDIGYIMEHYDAAIVNGSSLDAATGSDFGAYDQCRSIVERLEDPVLLTTVNRSLCERVLQLGLVRMAVDAARHGDCGLIGRLMDLGYLDAGAIDGVIDAVGALQDASMTGYLLEAKRRRFGAVALDFEL